MTTRFRGFTLIELLITMAIIGILAAIALPSFQSSVRNARLQNAKADLMATAQEMERYYTKKRTFSQTNSDNPVRLISDKSKDFFDISYTTDTLTPNPSADRYILAAKPNSSYKSTEQRYLILDSSTGMLVCTSSDSCTAY